MAGTVAAGAVLGLGLGWLVWGQKDQPHEIFAAFLQERCLPYVSGDAPDTSGLVALNLANQAGFVESDQKIVLRFSEAYGRKSCYISDILAPWSDDQRSVVLSTARNFAYGKVQHLNGGLLVEEDFTSVGIGDPLLIWRRPDIEQSAFLSFIFFGPPNDDMFTEIEFGRAQFRRPANGEDKTDA